MIVAANRDDAAVLIVLTVRQLNPSVPITASVREEENANLLRQSGADSVITTSATSGRLLGLSPDQPGVVHVVEDLLTAGRGLDLQQRTVTHSEVGLGPRQLRDVVLSVQRGGRVAALRRPADRHPAERRRARRGEGAPGPRAQLKPRRPRPAGDICVNSGRAGPARVRMAA